MFWERFVELCSKNNTSPNAVAKFIGISSASVTYWKNGSKPRDTALRKIADYFNVSIDYLLGKTDAPLSVSEQLSDELFALYGEVRDLTDEEKQKVLEFIKFTKSQRKEYWHNLYG